MRASLGNARVAALLLAAAALAGAAQASAAYTPRLVVSGSNQALSGLGSTTIDLELGLQADDATTGLVLYSPAGYSVRPGGVPGSTIGRVLRATVDTEGIVAEVDGTVAAGDPTAYPADPCAPGAHTFVWVVRLTGGSVDLTVPLFVDPVTDPAEQPLGAYRIRVCLPPQPRLLGLAVRLDRVFRNPPRRGNYLWRGIFTPIAAAADEVGPVAAVESRAILPLPAAIELEGSYRFPSRSVILRGRATVAGKPVKATTLILSSGAKRWDLRQSGVTRTDGRGRFRIERRIAKPTLYQASLRIPAEDVTTSACGSPAAPGGCVSATRSPVDAQSVPVRINVPPPPTLRIDSRGPAVRVLQDELVRLRYLPAGSSNGLYDERTWHAVVALQGWQGLPRDGNAGPIVWRELERAQRPRPWGGMRDGVEIDRTRQVLFLVRDGGVVRAVHVSTGAYGRTPGGRFAVYRKETLSWSIPFKTWMPYASYFSGGFAMHEYPSVPSYPASHGCVRVPGVEAPGVYAFAAYGTPVWIR
jgi:peptidoglycan hydrolase-like protein with peptidoglycan-binding domain